MLGTGNALVTRCYNTCFVMQTPGARLLVDAGGGNGVLRQLELAGITPDSLSADTEYGVNGWTTCQITARVPRIYVYNGQVVETRMLFC